MFWFEITITLFFIAFIFLYLNKTSPKTIDSIAPTELKLKTNTIIKHKTIILLLLIFSAMNFLLAEVLIVYKTDKITTCLNKIKRVANKVAVITTDGRYGMVIKRKK
jgi:uncharacterized membrane protein